jgi:hypothetical protein
MNGAWIISVLILPMFLGITVGLIIKPTKNQTLRRRT